MYSECPGGEPYGEADPAELATALQRGHRLQVGPLHRVPSEGVHCPLQAPRLAPARVQVLLQDCWAADPAHRPSFQQVGPAHKYPATKHLGRPC